MKQTDRGALACLGRSAVGYPWQFWLLVSSTLIFRAGSSLLFPFLTLLLHEQLGFSVAAAALAVGLGSAAGMAGVSLAGPMVDRFGRKRCLVLGLVAGSAVLVAMSAAGSFHLWCLLMVAEGVVMPLVRVGSNAMVADLVAPASRAGAAGYRRVLHDRPFLAFCAISVLTGMTYSLMETILPIHAKESVGLREAQLGLIMSASAAMVVLFQYVLTRIAERYPYLRVLAVAALLHGVGVGSVA